jgi:hypothetical protein
MSKMHRDMQRYDLRIFIVQFKCILGFYFPCYGKVSKNIADVKNLVWPSDTDNNV